MSDADSGSSSAAHSAQNIQTEAPRGFFSRVVDAIRSNSSDAVEPDRPSPPVSGVEGVSSLGLLNLHRMRVEDVAIPKAEIVSVPLDMTKEDLVKTFRDSGLTRLPVYEGTLDHPKGMIHLKDFALTHGFNGGGAHFSLPSMMRPLLFAPPSMPIGVLLQKMQSQRMHLALVIDEYGGVDGLVSIEDLIEQVIGEIEDEHDVDEDQYWTLEKPGCYLALSKTPLDEFEAEIGMKLVEGGDMEDVDTLGGLVFMLCGRVPARGEMIPHPNGPEFEIVDADPRRIKRLRVRVQPVVDA